MVEIEPAIQSGDDGQRMLLFDSCQLTFIRMSNISINGQSTTSVSKTFQPARIEGDMPDRVPERT